MAVAFLMSGSSVSLVLQDTDHGNNDADDCYYNTCDSDSKLYCQIYYVPFIVFSICTTSANTGSSQNVLILAKGEPLTVLAAPTFIIRYIGLFSYEFLRNKYTKFSILELAIFTDLDFVHFYQVSYYWYFQAVHSKKVPPEFSGGTFLC